MEGVKILEMLAKHAKARADDLIRTSENCDDAERKNSLRNQLNFLCELAYVCSETVNDLCQEPVTSREQSSAQPTIEDLLNALRRLDRRLDCRVVLSLRADGSAHLEAYPYNQFYKDIADAIKYINVLSQGTK